MDLSCRRTSLQPLLMLALALGIIALAWAGISGYRALMASAAPALEPDMCLMAPPTPYDPALGLPMDSPRAVPANARCPVCGMYPTRAPEWAAQVVFSNGDAQFFDSPASLFTYLHDVSRYTPGHSTDQIIASYVNDADSGGWLPALGAVYVQGSSARGPMRTGNLPAFADAASAQRFANLRGGVLLRAAEITPDMLPRVSHAGAHGP